MMPKYLWVHCLMWVSINLFGVFIMASQGKHWVALIFALLATAWIPSRIWIWQRYKKKYHEMGDN